MNVKITLGVILLVGPGTTVGISATGKLQNQHIVLVSGKTRTEKHCLLLVETIPNQVIEILEPQYSQSIRK